MDVSPLLDTTSFCTPLPIPYDTLLFFLSLGENRALNVNIYCAFLLFFQHRRPLLTSPVNQELRCTYMKNTVIKKGRLTLRSLLHYGFCFAT